MRIRMNTSLAGAFESYDHGQEYDVAEDLGRALCADGRASEVAPPPPSKPAKPRRGQNQEHA